MQATQNKIAKLEEQRAKLDKEILELQKKKNEEFLSLLNKIPSLHLEPMILIGGSYAYCRRSKQETRT